MNFQVQEGASTPHHTQPIHTTYSYISPHRNYHTSTTSCTQQLTLILILSTIRICLLVSHMSKIWWITLVNPCLGCRLPTQRQQNSLEIIFSPDLRCQNQFRVLQCYNQLRVVCMLIISMSLVVIYLFIFNFSLYIAQYTWVGTLVHCRDIFNYFTNVI